MKKSLKFFSFLTILGILLLGIVGCQDEKEVKGSLTEIMEKLYKDIPADKLPNLENIELTADNVANYLGTDTIKFEEALASEPLIGSIAHSVILLKTNDDVDDVKKQIKENINPRKWICVWVEDEDVIIKNKGNLVIAIVVENADIRNAISKNFDNL